jgi:hypothetical protein
MSRRARWRRAIAGAGRGAPERGQILVMFVGGIVLLFLIAGLVIDGGTAFLSRRDAQNSADVAALAGTKQLADFYLGKAPLDVYNTITASLDANGCGAGCDWSARYVGARSGASFRDLGDVASGGGSPPSGALGVKVDVTKRPHTYFLGVIGQSTWTVNTTATAISGKPSGAPAGQLLPIAMHQLANLKTGTIYALTNGKDAPGNFGWLAWAGTNSSKPLSDSICTPNNPSFTLPTSFAGDPGKSNASAVRGCLQQWVDSQEPVLIPIFDTETDKGNGATYHIIGIAAFTITGFSQPAVDQINGRFISTLPYSEGTTVPGGITEPPSTDIPFYYIGLTQ